MTEQFCRLLFDIYNRKNEQFSGVGLIMCNDITAIPVTPLKALDESMILPVTDYNRVLTFLVEFSDLQNSNHDGFHVLSKHFSLTHISQYFATPIVANKKPDLEFGSRYRTAFYGSFIEGVVACGVVSNNYGPVLFVKGQQIRCMPASGTRLE